MTFFLPILSNSYLYLIPSPLLVLRETRVIITEKGKVYSMRERERDRKSETSYILISPVVNR